MSRFDQCKKESSRWDRRLVPSVAIVPSFTLVECHRRGLLAFRLINPVVHLDLCQIQKGGKRLPRIAEEFTSFLRTYLVSWAGRPGFLSKLRRALYKDS